MATRSSVPAWAVPRTEEPGGLQLSPWSYESRTGLSDWSHVSPRFPSHPVGRGGHAEADQPWDRVKRPSVAGLLSSHLWDVCLCIFSVFSFILCMLCTCPGDSVSQWGTTALHANLWGKPEVSRIGKAPTPSFSQSFFPFMLLSLGPFCFGAQIPPFEFRLWSLHVA